MAITLGYKELSKQLAAMSDAVGGKALRSAAMSAMLPALRAAQKNAPVGNPPYSYGARRSVKTRRTITARTFDPYPVKTYKGRLRTPGFARRNVARKARISRDKRTVNVMLGVKPEAFYAVQFIELGTSRIPKQPWLEPAFRSSITEVDRRFRGQLKKLIDKAARTR
jgi:HK97 gp10 family phage protein